MLNAKRQQGMTLIGWMFVLGLIGFFAILVIKLWPIYYESFGVKRAVAKLPSQPEIGSMSEEQIWRIIEKQYTIDAVTNAKRDNFNLERDKAGQNIARVKYEVRVNILFNIDAVVWFDETAVIPKT